MSNEDIRRALRDSAAPGADIDLTYEEAEKLWASAREGTTSHPGVITIKSDISSIVIQHGHFEIFKFSPQNLEITAGDFKVG